MMKPKNCTIAAIMIIVVTLSLLLTACSNNNNVDTPTGHDTTPPTTASTPAGTPSSDANTPGPTPDKLGESPDNAGQLDDIDMNIFPGDIDRIGYVLSMDAGGTPYLLVSRCSLLYGDGFYVFDEHGGFFKVDLVTGEKTLFFENAYFVHIAAGWVYNISSEYLITHMIKTDGTGKTEFNGGGDYGFCDITNEYIYYTSFDPAKYEVSLCRMKHGEMQGMSIWENYPYMSFLVFFSESNEDIVYFRSWNIQTSEAENIRYEISSGTQSVFSPPSQMEVYGWPYGEFVYYGRIVDGNNVLFRSKYDGTDEQNVTPLGESAGNPTWGSTFEATLRGNYMVCEMVTKDLQRYYNLINLDTMERTRFEHNGATLHNITPYKGYVYFYYSDSLNTSGIFRMNADGTGIIQLCDDGWDFSINCDWIYFISGSEKEYGGDGLMVNQIRTNGTDEAQLFGPY